MYALRLLAKRLLALVVCDMVSSHCLRQSHVRFVLSSNELPPKLRKDELLSLKHGIIDQYQVDEESLIDVLFGNDRIAQTSMDANSATAPSEDY